MKNNDHSLIFLSSNATAIEIFKWICKVKLLRCFQSNFCSRSQMNQTICPFEDFKILFLGMGELPHGCHSDRGRLIMTGTDHNVAGTWETRRMTAEGGCPAGRPVPTWRIPTTRAFQGNVAAEPSEHGCFIIPFYPQGNGGPAKQIRNAFRTKFNYTYLFLSFLYFLYLTM